MYSQHGFQGTDEELSNKMTGDLEGLMDDTFIVGSPQECVEEVKRYQALGFNYILFDYHWPGLDDRFSLKNLKMLGEQVLPYIR